MRLHTLSVFVSAHFTAMEAWRRRTCVKFRSAAEAHRLAVNSSCCRGRNFQPRQRKILELPSAIHVVVDVNSRADPPTVFQNSVLLSTCARTNLTSQPPTPPEDKSLPLSLVSVWGERPNNSVFLSSSWKSSCTMFVLCKAAINGSRRAAKRPGTAGRGGAFFPLLLQNKKGVGDLSEMGVSWMTPHPSRAIHHMLTHTLATVSNSAGTRRW